MSARQLAMRADAGVIADTTPRLPSGYTCRPMRLSDEDELATLYLSSYGPDVVETADDARKEMSETFASAYGSLELAWSPVIEDGSRLVAAVMAVTSAPWPQAPQGPFIIEVIVHPAYRRRGLASCALKSSAEAVVASGGQTLSLYVISDNMAALRVYRRLGFEDC